MQLNNRMLNAVLAALLVMGLSACEKEGPAEKAGKALDQTAADIAEQAEEAGEAVADTMEEAGDKMEEASDNMQNQ